MCFRSNASNSIIDGSSTDDMHFPIITLGETLGFATKNRVPRRVRDDQGRKGVKEHTEERLTVVTDALGIPHTRHMNVGNEFIRGVSRGECKRVSIGEAIAAQGAISCWDNAIRGP